MADSGYIELSEVLQQLSDDDKLSYRMALLRDGNEWKAHTLFLDRIPQNGNEEPINFDYDYGNAFFSAGTIDGNSAKQWLFQRNGEITLLGRPSSIRRFTLQPFNGKAPWNRSPSYALQDFHRMPLPMTRYNVTGFGPAQYPTNTGFLLSDDAPFFPDFRTALLRLVYKVQDIDAIQQEPGAAVVVRLADTSAWLSNITLSPTAIDVTISGTRVGVSRITITGGGATLHDRQLDARRTVTCSLPNGIPSPLWIMLSRGNEWLDYYQRDERWGGFQFIPTAECYCGI